MAKIENLIIHCSDSQFGDAEVIRGWHKQQGWKDIGYNAIILNGYRKSGIYSPQDDGLLEVGRGLDFDTVISQAETGAHTLGYNGNSIGVCLIGVDRFSPKQWRTLTHFCGLWTAIVPRIKIRGHYHFNSNKTCPNFSVDSWWRLTNTLNFTVEGE